MTAQEHAVMQQALEALVKSLPRLAPHGEQDWLDSKAAITALLAALEQEPCDIAADGVCEALECCNVRTSALCPEQVRAQPEQEWLTGCPNCGMDGGCDCEALEQPEQERPTRQMPEWMDYDPATDVLTIHGRRYSASMFGEKGFLSPVGTLLQVAEGQPDCVTLMTEPLEQPEQEPVAYWHKPNQEDEEFIHAQAVNGKCPDCVPLYTHPHRREWRGLAEEEIIDAVRESDLDWHQGWTLEYGTPNRYAQLARAVEAALKERNT